jgi:uncharacterized repeat protein (TIGR03806 family)
MRLKALTIAALGLASLGAGPAPGSKPAPPVALDLILAEAPAKTLQAYRLFNGPGTARPNAGVIPYRLNTPLFTDYAEKARFAYLPPGTSARYSAEGGLDLPVGTVLAKSFAYPADLRRPDKDVRLIETRLLIRKASGWVANAYVWNADASIAELKRAGASLPVDFTDAKGRARHIDYGVPNVNQCKECHQGQSLDHRAEVTPLGPKARNLNGDYAYETGPENQLDHWSRLGLLAGAPKASEAPRTAVWDDPKESLPARARAYLDVNCGHCHNPAGFASNSGLYLTWEEKNPSALGLGKRPIAAGRGSGGLEVSVAPGDPDHSILVYRLASREPGVMMPPLGRSLAHEEGIALVRAYIASLPPQK